MGNMYGNLIEPLSPFPILAWLELSLEIELLC